MSDLNVPTLNCAGNVITLKLNEETVLKCSLPLGPQGPPGQCGISIKGDKGDKGEKGEDGRDGRDSNVPGPMGERGMVGACGPPLVLRMGNVQMGDVPSVLSSQVGNEVTFDFVLPRGQMGPMGRDGRDGKHGMSEIHTAKCLGLNPSYSDEMYGKHIILDGILMLPSEVSELRVGQWIHFKTLTTVELHNALEGIIVLQKNESARMVVIQYNNKYVLTRF